MKQSTKTLPYKLYKTNFIFNKNVVFDHLKL